MQNSECGMRNLKKRYFNPQIEITDIDVHDIITTSPGTETTPKEDNDGIWDLDLG